MHYFSNEPGMRVEFDGLKKRREGAYMYTYSLDDYPFTTILDSQKRDIRGELDSKTDADNKSELLAKRRPISEILRPEGIGVVGGVGLAFPCEPLPSPTLADGGKKVGPPNTLCIPAEKRGQEAGQEESMSQGSTAHFRNLDSDQAKALETFVEEMNGMLREISGKNNRDPKRDEDLIVLLTLKQFIMRFFIPKGESLLSPDPICKLMRSKVSVSYMILVLGSIKFRDKNSDMILVTVKQFTDIFLELIVSPQNFKPSQINFYRGGKGIVNLLIFVMQNFFQQVRILKNLSVEEPPSLTEGLFFLFAGQQSIDILVSLIDSVLDLCVLESAVAPIPNTTSAFQLHSQRHSQEHIPPPHEPIESEGVQASGNFMDRNMFNNSLIIRSNNMSKSKREHYSFELLGSGRFSPTKDDQKDREIGVPEANGNMNLFVSNLLLQRQKAKPTNPPMDLYKK